MYTGSWEAVTCWPFLLLPSNPMCFWNLPGKSPFSPASSSNAWKPEFQHILELTIWIEDGVHEKQKRVLFLDYLALMSCVERIPWGTRRNKTEQENNLREKVREISLEWHTCPREKRVQKELIQEEKRESWQPSDSRRSLHL